MNNTDYQNYQLQWMQDHAYSLEDLIMSLEEYRKDTFGLTLPELFHEREHNQGFNSEIWACENEFNDCEAQENQKQDVCLVSFAAIIRHYILRCYTKSYTKRNLRVFVSRTV